MCETLCLGIVLTLLMFFVGNRLNFTAMAVAGPLVHIECAVVYQVAILVHIPNRPIAQLAVVYDAAWRLLTITVRMIFSYVLYYNAFFSLERFNQKSLPIRKCAAREFGCFDALHFALAHRPHRQRITHDRFKKPTQIDCPEKALCRVFGKC